MSRPRLRGFLGLLLVLPLLAGCYVPSEFKMLIQITRDGQYVLAFSGNITSISVVRALTKPGITEQQIAEKVEVATTDLLRSSGFKTLEYQGKGLFIADYEEVGTLQRARSITFIHPTAKILTINYVEEENKVTVESVKVPENYIRGLIQLGLRPIGEIRVRTNAEVRTDNAGEILGNPEGVREYVWDIKGWRGPAPKIVLSLEAPAPAPTTATATATAPIAAPAPSDQP